MITWDPIAPGEVLLSSINWNPRLNGDTIVTSNWSASNPVGLTVTPGTPPFINGITQVWISNAVLGTVYTLVNTITTALGNIEIETVTFTCAQK